MSEKIATIILKEKLNASTAIDAKQGREIFKEITSIFDKADSVVLDFKGIELLTTAFLNKAIGELFEVYKDDVFYKLKIKNIADKSDLAMLKLVIKNSIEQFLK